MKRASFLLSITRCLAILLAVLTFAGRARAAGPTENVLYRFQGGSDGANPYASLIADQAGNLYGTTSAGGSSNCSAGCGTVFRLSPPVKPGRPWTETVLYRFQGGNDAAGPMAELIFDQAGNLYGTTLSGGGTNDGAVYQLAPPSHPGDPWTETVIHSFTGNDGDYPIAPLIFDPAGNLYGTTLFGGPAHLGTVFKLTPPGNPGGAWTETTLFRFPRSGGLPMAGLLLDSKGALYGAASEGTAFKLNPPHAGHTHWTEKALYHFGGGGDNGNQPHGLLAGKNGVFYGTTVLGGSPANAGMVFQLAPTNHGPWTLTPLYSFTNGSDGALPAMTPITDALGNLYGTAFAGGISANGTVFKLTPPTQPGGAWTETTLYQFQGASDGSNPSASLILGKDGALYGTTVSGGQVSSVCDSGSCGTVFRIVP
jgi:uncharacterized repeat protein (TIGR03803 family)